jgi:hypothetical protein
MCNNVLNKSSDCGCCRSELDLDRLCSDCIFAGCGKIKQIITNDVCSQAGEIKKLSAEDATLNNLCVPGSVKASQVWSTNSYTNSLCATNANIGTACISNLTIGNFMPCIKQRATVNYSVNAVYTLGNFLNFTNIVDDPNGNVTLVPNTTYTAPVAGYYDITFKVNVTNLVSSSGPILGIPVANPQIYVNGMLVREMYSPFLSFFNTQKVILDSLITLQQGDQVTMKYDVLGGNGTPVTGTVDIGGAGIEDGNSLFKIILLSGLCGGGDQNPCPMCPAVTIPCVPFTTPCLPLGSGNVPNPCESCQ